jgi:hypothetical protein
MARPKLSNEKKAQLRETLDKQLALNAEQKKLYNITFRKSALFIISWTLRLAFIAFFIFVVVLQTKSSSFTEEIVTEKYIDRNIESSKLSLDTSMAISTLYLETNFGHYTADISGLQIPGFDINDTLLIHRNLFNKPIYFGKHNWLYRYELSSNLGAYLFVLFLTLVSLFFNDGQDKFTKKILVIFSIVDIITTVCYFLF